MFSGNAYGSYGGGAGYSSSYGLSTANISYETNSKDPLMQRARVFVGNIMTSKVGRDEIIQLFSNYGKLLGVTVFKGYAFVQFSHGTEADLAVSALNGYIWNGAALDVKLATHGIQGQQQKSSGGSGSTQMSAKGTGKRMKNELPPQEAAAAKDLKRMKIDQGIAPGKNNANKTFAATLNEMDTFITPHDDEVLDTLICGKCRFVTNSLSTFVEHRKDPCKIGEKPAGEPELLGCISCDEQFDNSWALLTHHNNVHIRPLFKEVSNANGSGGDYSGLHDDAKLEPSFEQSSSDGGVQQQMSALNILEWIGSNMRK